MEIHNKTTEKWVSTAIYYDKMESLLTDAVVPFLQQEIYSNKGQQGISNFIFNRSWERGQNLLLLFKGNDKACEELVKLKLTDHLKKYIAQHPAADRPVNLPVLDWFLPFPSNHIEYYKTFLFDMMETGGLQSSHLVEELLTCSSALILDFFEASSEEGWDAEAAIGIALQIHLVLTSSFGMTTDEMREFYHYMFNNMLKMTQGDDEHFQETLQSGLKENYESQKESIVGFVEFLVETLVTGDEFDEDWVNQWIQQTKNIAQKMQTIQEEGYFVAPEGYQYNEQFKSSKLLQEKWPVIEYSLRSINCQMAITNVFELNLIYTLKESLNSIVEEAKL